MIPRGYLAAIGLVVLASIALSAVMASRIEDPAPIHWNLRGEIDGYGPRWLAICLVPALASLVAGLLVVLPRFGALGRDAESWIVPYSRLALGVVLLLGAIGACYLFAAATPGIDLVDIVLLLTGLFVAFMGASIRGVKRNALVGIRTPWTLRSDAVWDSTHRAGGARMAAVGLLTAAGALVLPVWAGLVVLLAGLAAFVVWAFIYSSREYRRLGDGVAGATREAHRT